jgi:dTDP-4-amino-4,6-dideoxygalactose transaminase
MAQIKYNSFPLGRIPLEKQRPEFEQIRELGYRWDDPRDIVDIFEKRVARFSGSKFGVSTDCCTNGIFLGLIYLKQIGELKDNDIISIPRFTYASIPMQLIHCNLKIKFTNEKWRGIYNLGGTRIYDGAVRWTKDMFVGGNAIHVLSFQFKKRIPIGRGGMILTNSEEEYNWFKLATYDGRDLKTQYTDKNHFKMLGYHMYMTPEDAARGILLMNLTPEENDDSGGYENYTDMEKIFKNLNIEYE